MQVFAQHSKIELDLKVFLTAFEQQHMMGMLNTFYLQLPWSYFFSLHDRHILSVIRLVITRYWMRLYPVRSGCAQTSKKLVNSGILEKSAFYSGRTTAYLVHAVTMLYRFANRLTELPALADLKLELICKRLKLIINSCASQKVRCLSYFYSWPLLLVSSWQLQ